MTRQLRLFPVYAICDCAESAVIRHPDTMVFRPRSSKEAAELYVKHVHARANCGAPSLDMYTSGDCLWKEPCHWHAGKRYLLICDGANHVVGVTTRSPRC